MSCALVALAGWWRFPAGVLLGLLVAWYWWHRAERFSEQVRLYVNRVASGDWRAGFGRREGGAFGSVQASLESLHQELATELEGQAHARRQLESALQGMQDGVLVCDADGGVLFMNPSFKRLMAVEEPLRRRYFFWECFREPALHQAITVALKQASGSTVDLAWPGGAERYARAVITPFEAADAANGGAVALLYDRTEEKRLERMRSDFVSSVSHELRTPLTAIKAALETLRDGAIDDPKVNTQFLDKAIVHSERLYELIGDLLTLAGIEERKRLGQVDAEAQCQVAESWAEALEFLEPSARNHKGKLQAFFQDGLPAVRMDKTSLRQVWVNLVENALKYSGPEPQVTLKAAIAEPGWVLLEILDQGPGIPEADLKRVFERFYRVDKARTRGAAGGSGLGLAIVKHLVENQGGQIGVESPAGQGCRFWIRLRVAQDR
jgi:two-component system phosphate regulon sensor histidine kinase PhoR